jgi:hypothetical protein
MGSMRIGRADRPYQDEIRIWRNTAHYLPQDAILYPAGSLMPAPSRDETGWVTERVAEPTVKLGSGERVVYIDWAVLQELQRLLGREKGGKT